MPPSGFITIESVAEKFGVAIAAVDAAIAKAAVARFSVQGVDVISEGEVERLRNLVGPPTRATGEALTTALLDSNEALTSVSDSQSLSGSPSEAELDALLETEPDEFGTGKLREAGPVPSRRQAGRSGSFTVGGGLVSNNVATKSAPGSTGVSRLPAIARIDAQGEPRIDTRHRLFVSGASTAQIKNAKRVINQPEKFAGNPVIMPDTPWEEDGLCTLGGTVIYDRDDQCYKMWYYAVTQLGRSACFAFSQDGIKWEKPSLGVVRFGARDTNIVMVHPTVEHYSEIVGVVKDDQDTDSAKRYKLAYLKANPNGVGRTLRTAISPDGFRWKPLPSQIGEVNETSHFVRDADGRFVVYGRSMRNSRRAVTRFESEDFFEWTAGEMVLASDGKDPEGDDLYSLTSFPCGEGSIGLAQMFHSAPHYTLDFQLAWSIDGFAWERVADRGVFIPSGGVGSWDRFQISTASHPVTVGSRNDLWFYYGSRTQRHAPYLGADKGPLWGGIGVARLRPDGFVSLETSFDGGLVVTPPVRLAGEVMHVNVSAAFGVLGVTVLDAQGKAIPGMVSAPISADGIDIPVVWPGGQSLSALRDRVVRIAFAFKNAKLYSYWMT